ncbi:MAG TPA: DUF3800 domain-containing protein [Terracidiphilus sp.]|jgi:hypothetical protein|nr:DUF3800 domain-containing protein [Terracidiphilus sp.]
MERYAYTDESGNSGFKLFNSGQDTFWTGTLIAFADVDRKYVSFHKELLAAVGKPELHGNDLGFGGIEKIASRLAWFIREKRFRFYFGRVHKPFLAGSKMFDLAFDSGANPAMPNHAYGLQQLRLLTLMHFIQLLNREDLEEFWDLFQKQEPHQFGELLAKVIPRVGQVPYDERTKTILTDVLTWGSAHPQEILDPFGEGDSPNFVAFSGLFDHLHRLHLETGDTVGSFVHDEQNQFVPYFKIGFELLSRFVGKNHPLAMISDIEEIRSFNCSLVEKPSAQSFGLQLLDVCLWLMRRIIDNNDRPRGGCLVLAQCLRERSWLARFDFANLVSQVEEGTKFVNDLPMTEEDFDRGRKYMREFEEARQSRIAAPS